MMASAKMGFVFYYIIIYPFLFLFFTMYTLENSAYKHVIYFGENKYKFIFCVQNKQRKHIISSEYFIVARKINT